MSLAAGARLGAYEIVGLLGAGGMGEVYRARDPKLQREVAIKILPERFAADRDRLARFQREAQVLASLNHPNIAAIYGTRPWKPRRRGSAYVTASIVGDPWVGIVCGGARALRSGECRRAGRVLVV
jgi:hypothetical protein